MLYPKWVEILSTELFSKYIRHSSGCSVASNHVELVRYQPVAVSGITGKVILFPSCRQYNQTVPIVVKDIISRPALSPDYSLRQLDAIVLGAKGKGNSIFWNQNLNLEVRQIVEDFIALASDKSNKE